MDQYQQEMMAGQLLDLGFLAQHMPLDGIEYHLQDGTLMASQHIKREPYEIEYVGSFGNPQQQPDSRSYSCSSATSQPLSPILHDPHPELYALQMNNLPFTGRTEQLSPTTTDHSRKESDDENQRTERRRAQNRAAQRAYRQRKDLSLKQREREVESLREELDKAQRLNKTLCKVVSVLRGRLKDKPESSGGDEC